MDHPNYLIGVTIQGYTVTQLLGKGGFAYVYRAKQNGGPDVALKVINKDLIKNEELRKRVEKEAEIHSSLNHESIIKLYEFFKEGNCVFLVLELCHNGTLTHYIEERRYPFSEAKARDIMNQVVDGVIYLHSNSIMHRDLSPRNLLLTSDEKVKIADFGLAADTEDKHKTMCGTPNFMSPEVATRSLYGPEVDVWSLGCLLYHLLVGKPPFDAKGIRRTLTNVVRDECKLPPNLSTEAKDLIQLMLRKDAKRRIKLKDIKNHRFMNVPVYYNKSLSKGTSSIESGLGSSLTSSTSGRKSQSHRVTNDCVLELDTIQSTGLSDYCGSSRPCCDGDVVYRNPQNCFTSPPVRHSSWENIPASQNPIGLLKTKLPALPSFDSQLNQLRARQRSPIPRDFEPRGRERDISEERKRQEALDAQRSDHYQEDMKQFHSLFVNNNPRKKTSSDCCVASHSNSCSHHQLCCSDSVQCSHAELCHCRRSAKTCSLDCLSRREDSGCCHHPKYSQEVQNRSQHSGCRSPSPKPPLAKPKCLSNHVDCLNTILLRPTRQRTRNAVVSILENGEVCVEFVKKIKQAEKVVDVCRISKDGLRIIIYKPGRHGIPVKNTPPPVPKDGADDIYSFQSLPEKHWKKYEYAARFVQLVRAKTARLTYYSALAKCIMMENFPNPDFEVSFYSGGKITKTSLNCKNNYSSKCSYKIIDATGISTVVYDQHDVEGLRPQIQHMWEHFQEVEEQCTVLEQALAKVEKSSSKPCFPAIIGRRPNNAPQGLHENNNKENVTPSTIKSPLSTAVNHSIMSYNGTINTEPYLSDGSSPNNETLPERSSLRRSGHPSSQHFRDKMASTNTEKENIPDSVFVIGVGMLSQSPNGICIQYLDRSKLCVPASDSGQIVFTSAQGEIMRFGQHSAIPKDVQDKLSQVESIVQQLYRTSNSNRIRT